VEKGMDLLRLSNREKDLEGGEGGHVPVEG